MITTIRLVNIHHHTVSLSVCVMITFKIYSLGNFQIHTTELLTIVTRLYVSSYPMSFSLVPCLYTTLWASVSFSLKNMDRNSCPICPIRFLWEANSIMFKKPVFKLESVLLYCKVNTGRYSVIKLLLTEPFDFKHIPGLPPNGPLFIFKYFNKCGWKFI